MQLVQCRTAQILAISNLFARHTGAQMHGPEVKRLDGAQVGRFGLAPDVTLAIRANLAVLQTLQEQIDIVEKRLMQQVKLNPDYALLNTVPGIGPVLATTIMLETGTISRFATVGHFSSWTAGAKATAGRKVKATRRTATATWHGHLSKRPNFANRTCPQARRFYERKKRMRNGIVAIKALAHKLARACYHMLREHKPFETVRCFGQQVMQGERTR
jgi:transposase